VGCGERRFGSTERKARSPGCGWFNSASGVRRARRRSVTRVVAPGVVLIVAGIAVMAVAWTAATGRLKRNWIAGLRLKSTMRSDAAWLAAHRRAKIPFSATGAMMVAGGVLLAVADRTTGVAVALGTAVVGAAVALVAGY